MSEATVPDACGSRGIKDSTDRLVKLLSTGVAGVGREEHAEVCFFDEEPAAGPDSGRHPARCPFGLGKVHEKSSAMHEVVGPRLEVLCEEVVLSYLDIGGQFDPYSGTAGSGRRPQPGRMGRPCPPTTG